ncbi:peptide ABC transporter [Clostridium sp. P21]|uniref:Peptide ABC transporter n=1 Tax=Clostridium muellerianum TaxID=2716538 RepID=A0A7Y0EG99_9CLOT|nr:peptide-binding protein [Clostridium muellerianum]NMM62893.1 peptide ABC transporter [Clostridium muellerianum]
MKKKKIFASICLLVTLSFAATACGSNNTAATPTKKQDLKNSATEIVKAKDPSKVPQNAKNRKDTLIVGSNDAPKGNMNALTAQSLYDQYAYELVFDTLISNDEQGNPVPTVAEKWEISSDGTKYTFHLKKDVKFSDGTPLTAEDVAFTYTALCDPNYDGQISNQANHIKGYKEYNKGDAKTVEGIKVVDPYTIEITLSSPKASALWDLGGITILSKKYYGFEKGNFQRLKSLDQKPMGSGPYIMKKFKPGQEVDFESNPSYWRGPAKIKNIIMKKTDASTMIQEITTGGVDVNLIPAKPENISMLDGAGFINKQFYTDNGYGYMAFNLKDPRFQDKKVRQALTYGLNRQGFVDSYYKGYASVCNQPFSPNQWAYSEDVNQYKYDPDKAGKMLDEAGWKLNSSDGYRYKDGKKFTINWLTYTGSKYEDSLISIAKDSWKKIGVELIPQSMDFNSVLDKADKRQYEIYNMSWSLVIDPDSTQIFHSSQDVPGGSNNMSFRNADSDKLLEEGLKVTDKAKRKEIYNKWAKLINEELPYIFLDQTKYLWGVSSRVEGMKISPFRDWTYDIYKVELK